MSQTDHYCINNYIVVLILLIKQMFVVDLTLGKKCKHTVQPLTCSFKHSSYNIGTITCRHFHTGQKHEMLNILCTFPCFSVIVNTL